MHLIAQAAGMKRKGGGKLRVQDFLPGWCHEAPEEGGEEELKAQLMALSKRNHG